MDRMLLLFKSLLVERLLDECSGTQQIIAQQIIASPSLLVLKIVGNMQIRNCHYLSLKNVKEH